MIPRSGENLEIPKLCFVSCLLPLYGRFSLLEKYLDANEPNLSYFEILTLLYAIIQSREIPEDYCQCSACHNLSTKSLLIYDNPVLSVGSATSDATIYNTCSLEASSSHNNSKDPDNFSDVDHFFQSKVLQIKSTISTAIDDINEVICLHKQTLNFPNTDLFINKIKPFSACLSYSLMSRLLSLLPPSSLCLGEFPLLHRLIFQYGKISLFSRFNMTFDMNHQIVNINEGIQYDANNNTYQDLHKSEGQGNSLFSIMLGIDSDSNSCQNTNANINENDKNEFLNTSRVINGDDTKFISDTKPCEKNLRSPSCFSLTNLIKIQSEYRHRHHLLRCFLSILLSSHDALIQCPVTHLSPIHVAAICNASDLIKILTRGLNVNPNTPTVLTSSHISYPIHTAVRNGFYSSVHALIEGGCRMDLLEDSIAPHCPPWLQDDSAARVRRWTQSCMINSLLTGQQVHAASVKILGIQTEACNLNYLGEISTDDTKYSASELAFEETIVRRLVHFKAIHTDSDDMALSFTPLMAAVSKCDERMVRLILETCSKLDKQNGQSFEMINEDVDNALTHLEYVLPGSVPKSQPFHHENSFNSHNLTRNNNGLSKKGNRISSKLKSLFDCFSSQSKSVDNAMSKHKSEKIIMKKSLLSQCIHTSNSAGISALHMSTMCHLLLSPFITSDTTPVHPEVAATKIFDLLIEYDSNIYTRDALGRNPLTWAILCQNKHAVRGLTSQFAHQQQKLGDSFKKCSSIIVSNPKLLLDKSCSSSFNPDFHNKQTTGLKQPCIENRLSLSTLPTLCPSEIFGVSLSTGNACSVVRYFASETYEPLLLAVSQKQEKNNLNNNFYSNSILFNILTQCDPVNSKKLLQTDFGPFGSVLTQAIWTGNVDTVRSVLSALQSLKILEEEINRPVTNNHWTPLMVAIQSFTFFSLQSFMKDEIQRSEMDNEMSNEEDETRATKAGLKEEMFVKIVSVLLASGACPSKTSLKGLSSFHMAAFSGSIEILSLLIDNFLSGLMKKRDALPDKSKALNNIIYNNNNNNNYHNMKRIPTSHSLNSNITICPSTSSSFEPNFGTANTVSAAVSRPDEKLMNRSTSLTNAIAVSSGGGRRISLSILRKQNYQDYNNQENKEDETERKMYVQELLKELDRPAGENQLTPLLMCLLAPGALMQTVFLKSNRNSEDNMKEKIEERGNFKPREFLEPKDVEETLNIRSSEVLSLLLLCDCSPSHLSSTCWGIWSCIAFSRNIHALLELLLYSERLESLNFDICTEKPDKLLLLLRGRELTNPNNQHSSTSERSSVSNPIIYENNYLPSSIQTNKRIELSPLMIFLKMRWLEGLKVLTDFFSSIGRVQSACFTPVSSYGSNNAIKKDVYWYQDSKVSWNSRYNRMDLFNYGNENDGNNTKSVVEFLSDERNFALITVSQAISNYKNANFIGDQDEESIMKLFMNYQYSPASLVSIFMASYEDDEDFQEEDDENHDLRYYELFPFSKIARHQNHAAKENSDSGTHTINDEHDHDGVGNMLKNWTISELNALLLLECEVIIRKALKKAKVNEDLHDEVLVLHNRNLKENQTDMRTAHTIKEFTVNKNQSNKNLNINYYCDIGLQPDLNVECRGNTSSSIQDFSSRCIDNDVDNIKKNLVNSKTIEVTRSTSSNSKSKEHPKKQNLRKQNSMVDSESDAEVSFGISWLNALELNQYQTFYQDNYD